MKKINHQIKLMLAAVLVGVGITSCSLDMLPLNDIVLENYWTNKSDVESVVNSCYAGLKGSGYISDMIVWGECRSDNTDIGPDVPTSLRNLMKGSLKSTNTYCNWSAMYDVINRCNTVLYYAPQVHEKDPNYTESDLAINIAECKSLRALSYLTLIKTFRDVPFSLEPSIDDNMDFLLPRTEFEVILDALIKDIEEVKEDLPIEYGAATPIYNTAKFTRPAAYALLAEMYLWRASDNKLALQEQNDYYQKCIDACNWVIDYKKRQMQANTFYTWRGNTINLADNIDDNVWNQYSYPLLSEVKGNGSQTTAPYAFNSIFSEGNSFESLFEITFHYSGTQESNSEVVNFYGGQTSTGGSIQYLVAADNLMTSAPTDVTTYTDNQLFSVCTDFRSAAPFHFSDNGTYTIYKYTVDGVSLRNTSSTGKFTYPEAENRVRTNLNQDISWIVYRLTEVMLFRAEAEIELAGNLNAIAAADEVDDNAEVEEENDESEEFSGNENNTVSLTPEELYDDAFNIISAVYLRSNPAVKNLDKAKPTRAQYNTHEGLENLLMNERRREFLFEGKRYFDLVRQARREGNTSKFQTALTSKFGEASKAVVIKMSMMDFMYMPILKTQIQVNPKLTQNPAYAEEENVEIN